MQIATVARIPVRLHSSFWILAIAFGGWELYTEGLGQMLWTLGLLTLLFGSVVIHEFGHALAARRYNIQTASITLYPFGGIARMPDLSSAPKQEMMVAAAGPLVNIAIALLSAGLWWFSGLTVLMILAVLNLLMAAFNLIPAYPMDGGRMLRAALSARFGWHKGTTISLSVGRWIAYGFLLASFPTESWGLAFVGAFLLLSHRTERRNLATRTR